VVRLRYKVVFSLSVVFVLSVLRPTNACADEHHTIAPTPLTKNGSRYVICKPEEQSAALQMLNKLRREEKPTISDLAEISNLVKKVPNGCLSKDNQRDLETVLAWFGILPCEESDFKKNITAEVSGDDHFEPEYIKRKEPLLIRAEKDSERLLVGSESPVDKGSKNAFYLEEGSVASLAALSTAQRDFIKPFSKKAILRTFYDASLMDPEFLSIWAHLAGQQPAELRNILNNYLNGKVRWLADWVMERQIGTQDELSISKLLNKLVLIYLNKVENPENKFHFLTPNLSEFRRHLGEKDLDTALISWRTRYMAARAASLLCEAGRRGSDIRFFVGFIHVPEFYTLLKEMIDRSHVDSPKTKLDRTVQETDLYSSGMKNSDKPYLKRIVQFYETATD
jgi:hypothetical protein